MKRLFVVVIAWGLSWYAIRLQVGEVAPVVSVGWRFLIAGIALLLWLTLRSKFEFPARSCWPKIAGLGVFLFGANFVSFYYAAPHLPSGLISVIFAMAVFVVAINEWVWRRKKPDAKTMVGAMFGITGLLLLFGPAVIGDPNQNQSSQGAIPLLGLALSILGTWFFSIGNLITQSLPKDLHMPSMISCAMLLSAVTCLAIGLFTGNSLALPAETVYLAALAYLAIGASVIAFICYLSLVKTNGAAKASYATVLFPVVALGISTALEGYEWSLLAATGAALALIGAFIVFRPVKTAKA